MRIVTADEIVAAFEKTGIEPKQRTLGDDTCGCAIAAIHKVEGKVRFDEYQWFKEQTGLTGMWALIHGFDGESPQQLPKTCTHPNYFAGREAAKRLGLPVEE